MTSVKKKDLASFARARLDVAQSEGRTEKETASPPPKTAEGKGPAGIKGWVKAASEIAVANPATLAVSSFVGSGPKAEATSQPSVAPALHELLAKPVCNISSGEIKARLPELVRANLDVGQRTKLLETLLDDLWVAPLNLWDAGLVANNQEACIAQLIGGTPEKDVNELAKRLVETRASNPRVQGKSLVDLIYSRVNKPENLASIDQVLGPTLLAASIERTRAAALGNVVSTSPNTRVDGRQRSRLNGATQDASRFLMREYFPMGGPIRGVSYRSATGKDTKVGTVELLAHPSEGAPIALGELNLAKYEKQDQVFKAIVDRFNEYHYGRSGPRALPPPWVNLASDLVPPGERPGSALLPLVKWSGGAAQFQMPLEAYQTLLGRADLKTPDQLTHALKERLQSLGVAQPSAKAANEGGKPSIRLSLEDAELLLKSRRFNAASRPFLSEANGNWESLQVLNGQTRFVLPAAAFGRFDLVVTKSKPPSTAELMEAVKSRMASFGVGSTDVQKVSINGKEALSVSPEMARLLMKTSTFDFHPHSTSLDTDNLYWSARFADLAYVDPKTNKAELERTLKSWGFNKFETISHNGAESLVASNGKMVMVACRGTADGADAVSDMKFLNNGKVAQFIKGLEGDGKLSPTDLQGEKLKLHGGFASQVLGELPQVQAAISAQQTGPDGTKLPVWVTGHSKGGAEASLMAVALELQGTKVAGGYGIEGARAGDASLVEVAKRLGLADHWFQFQMEGDPVPHVPPRIMGFQQFGTALVSDNQTGDMRWGLDAFARDKEAMAHLPLGGVFSHMMRHKNGVLRRMEESLLDVQWTPPKDEVPWEN